MSNVFPACSLVPHAISTRRPYSEVHRWDTLQSRFANFLTNIPYRTMICAKKITETNTLLRYLFNVNWKVNSNISLMKKQQSTRVKPRTKRYHDSLHLMKIWQPVSPVLWLSYCILLTRWRTQGRERALLHYRVFLDRCSSRFNSSRLQFFLWAGNSNFPQPM